MNLFVKTLLDNKQKNKELLFVKKRNGRIVNFDIEKIKNAIFKAFSATGEGDVNKAWEVTAYVVSALNGNLVDIERIQDAVEDTLMNLGFRQTAKKYILYRAKRAELRNIEKVFTDSMDLIDNYINVKDWRINENSNMSYSLQGLNAHISAVLTSDYWLSKIYTTEIEEAHRNGFFHIHDLGSLSAYCVGWDLEQLLLEGFGGVYGKVASKPAKHFRTALGQIVNFFYTLQGEAAGAQAFANFDTFLAPFIRYDKLSYKEVKQAIQEFVFNLNVPTRTGFQTPFTNITLDLEVPDYLKEQAVVIGGRIKDQYYGDFQYEMDMINNAFAEVMLEGDANGRPFTFPIPTYNITENFQWDNPNFVNIWKMTAKYGTPYFSNFINSNMSVSDARSMCCRLRLDNRELRSNIKLFSSIDDESNDSQIRRGGLFSANPMTGSIGVITINLPKLAYIFNSQEDFFNKLDNMMVLAKTALEIKRKVIEDLTDKGLYPYTKRYLADIKNKTGNFWTNHFSTIGLIGMNEVVLNLHKIPYYSNEGAEFANKILDFMLNKLENFRKETGNLYNLEASPAEGASYRLAKIDKKQYPDIITAGTANTPYYTNSVHLPVNVSDDIFEILDFQDELQAKFTGGTVVHIFLGEYVEDYRTIAELIKIICYNYKLPYFSITPTFSICPIHGYIPGKYDFCPYEHSEEDLKLYGVFV